MVELNRRRENYALWQVSWGVFVEKLVQLRQVPALQHAHIPVRELEINDNDSYSQQLSSVLAVPATQTPSTDAPIETSETTTEPGRDLDV